MHFLTPPNQLVVLHQWIAFSRVLRHRISDKVKNLVCKTGDWPSSFQYTCNRKVTQLGRQLLMAVLKGTLLGMSKSFAKLQLEAIDRRK